MIVGGSYLPPRMAAVKIQETLCSFGRQIDQIVVLSSASYTVSQTAISDVFSCNFSKYCQILIILAEMLPRN